MDPIQKLAAHNKRLQENRAREEQEKIKAQAKRKADLEEKLASISSNAAKQALENTNIDFRLYRIEKTLGIDDYGDAEQAEEQSLVKQLASDMKEMKELIMNGFNTSRIATEETQRDVTVLSDSIAEQDISAQLESIRISLSTIENAVATIETSVATKSTTFANFKNELNVVIKNGLAKVTVAATDQNAAIKKVIEKGFEKAGNHAEKALTEHRTSIEKKLDARYNSTATATGLSRVHEAIQDLLFVIIQGISDRDSGSSHKFEQVHSSVEGVQRTVHRIPSIYHNLNNLMEDGMTIQFKTGDLDALAASVFEKLRDLLNQDASFSSHNDNIGPTVSEHTEEDSMDQSLIYNKSRNKFKTNRRNNDSDANSAAEPPLAQDNDDDNLEANAGDQNISVDFNDWDQATPEKRDRPETAGSSGTTQSFTRALTKRPRMATPSMIWKEYDVGGPAPKNGKCPQRLLSVLPEEFANLVHSHDQNHKTKHHRSTNVEMNQGRPRLCFSSVIRPAPIADWAPSLESGVEPRKRGRKGKDTMAAQRSWWESVWVDTTKVCPKCELFQNQGNDVRCFYFSTTTTIRVLQGPGDAGDEAIAEGSGEAEEVVGGSSSIAGGLRR